MPKKTRLPAVLILLATVLAVVLIWLLKPTPVAPPTESLLANQPAPEFSLTDLHGVRRSLQDFRGKLVLLNFWATWCPPCVVEMSSLERLSQIYRAQGLEVVAISADKVENDSAVSDFVESRGISFTVLRDPNLQAVKAYGLTGFPETFFIDAEGRLMEVVEPGKSELETRLISDRAWDSRSYLQFIGELVAKGKK